MKDTIQDNGENTKCYTNENVKTPNFSNKFNQVADPKEVMNYMSLMYSSKIRRRKT